MRITAKELAMLKAIRDDQYHDSHGPLSQVWAWSPCDAFGRSAGGIMASLNQKGLAISRGCGEDATIELTQAGLVKANKWS